MDWPRLPSLALDLGCFWASDWSRHTLLLLFGTGLFRDRVWPHSHSFLWSLYLRACPRPICHFFLCPSILRFKGWPRPIFLLALGPGFCRVRVWLRPTLLLALGPGFFRVGVWSGEHIFSWFNLASLISGIFQADILSPFVPWPVQCK